MGRRDHSHVSRRQTRLGQRRSARAQGEGNLCSQPHTPPKQASKRERESLDRGLLPPQAPSPKQSKAKPRQTGVPHGGYAFKPGERKRASTHLDAGWHEGVGGTGTDASQLQCASGGPPTRRRYLDYLGTAKLRLLDIKADDDEPDGVNQHWVYEALSETIREIQRAHGVLAREQWRAQVQASHAGLQQALDAAQVAGHQSTETSTG